MSDGIRPEHLEACDKIFMEKESGAKSERKELERLLEFVREGDIVKVTKLCRLARNTKHLLEVVDFLDEKKVSLQVLNLGIDTSSPTGRLMLTMIGAVAAFERELLLERQAEGIAIAKLKGKYRGRKPTARAKRDYVLELLSSGMSKLAVSQRLNISISSIYRVIQSE
ncbi:recombinase family protein [Shewanella baltica]|uniref:recombinase family protein n=1 Tax=Shewanella baltica TaxID=62322 RepID=UPI003D7957AB